MNEINEWELDKVAHFLVKNNPGVFRGVEGAKRDINALAESVKLGSYIATMGFVVFKCNNGYVKVAIDSCILPRPTP